MILKTSPSCDGEVFYILIPLRASGFGRSGQNAPGNRRVSGGPGVGMGGVFEKGLICQAFEKGNQIADLGLRGRKA